MPTCPISFNLELNIVDPLFRREIFSTSFNRPNCSNTGRMFALIDINAPVFEDIIEEKGDEDNDKEREKRGR
jgi:hypothetical protein